MRMISADSLLTIVLSCLSQSTGTVTRPEYFGIGGDIDVVQERLRAVDRVRHDAGAGLEGPAVARPSCQFTTESADHALEPFQLAEDQRAMRPGTGVGDVEVIAAGLRLEAALAARARRSRLA